MLCSAYFECSKPTKVTEQATKVSKVVARLHYHYNQLDVSRNTPIKIAAVNEFLCYLPTNALKSFTVTDMTDDANVDPVRATTISQQGLSKRSRLGHPANKPMRFVEPSL